MKHVLGAPLVSKVLNQVINKRECWVFRQYRATRNHFLEAADNRRRVGYGTKSVLFLKQERRQKTWPGLLNAQRVAHLLGLSPGNCVRQAPVAQERQHFLGIGGACAPD